MRNAALLRICVIGAALAASAAALAAPGVDARDAYQRAARLDADGDAESALALIDKGLAAAPKDLPLLGLKGAVLLKLRDYAGALAAYQAYLDAGATGANRRQAQQIVSNLAAVKSTFLDVALSNGPASIYLDSKTQGLFCTAAPSCHQGVLPGEYKVIAERPGFERWTGQVAVEADKATKVAISLTELPSQLTVRVAQPGARITVDGAAYERPMAVPPGKHAVAISLAGHADLHHDVVAGEGKPLELDLSLMPLVPVRGAPPGAQLTLDGAPVELRDEAIPLPPGAHVLVARAKGFQDLRIEIPADRAADYAVAVQLAPVPAPRRDAEPGGRIDETTALHLSLEATALSWAVVLVATAADQSHSDEVNAVGLAGAVVGPSVGHWYAHSFPTAGVAVRALGVAAVLLGSEARDEGSDAGTALVVAGAGLVAASTVYDILTAPRRARQYNGRVVSVAPVIRGDGAQLAIIGRF